MPAPFSFGDRSAAMLSTVMYSWDTCLYVLTPLPTMMPTTWPLLTSIRVGLYQELVRTGRALEFFAEGGRSRHGTVAQLKLGLIGMLVECVWRGAVGDVVVVPIGLDYDRVPEAGSHASQLLGHAKVCACVCVCGCVCGCAWLCVWLCCCMCVCGSLRVASVPRNGFLLVRCHCRHRSRLGRCYLQLGRC